MSSLFDALTADYGITERRTPLTPEEVRDIRARYASGVIRQVDLAEEYGVNQSQISRIVNRKRRKGVE